MRKRLLVTGYGGFVAGNVVFRGKDHWNIEAITSPRRKDPECLVPVHSLDLRDSKGLRALFKAARPDAVIHAAARADIDYCQSHRSEAESINVGVTGSLAALCHERECRLVYCSTDTVFDGKKGHYTETDTPSPVNFYGETKVRAEKEALDHAENRMVARLALVMGFPSSGSGNSFLAKMIASLETGKEVAFPENEIRTPIDVITLADALLELAGNDFQGVLHLAGNTRLNRYEWGRRIVERLGYPLDLIRATDSNAMPGRAPRPCDASLDNSKARSILRTPMLGLEEGLASIERSMED
jgi:dTDP-4-dehydrorhamnose reductase